MSDRDLGRDVTLEGAASLVGDIDDALAPNAAVLALLAVDSVDGDSESFGIGVVGNIGQLRPLAEIAPAADQACSLDPESGVSLPSPGVDVWWSPFDSVVSSGSSLDSPAGES